MTHRIKRRPHKIKSKKSIIKSKGFWRIILVIILLLGISYFVIFFDKVQIKNISISDNIKAPTNQIESLVLQEINKKILFLQSRSIFLINTSKVRSVILEGLPIVKEARITRKFFNALNVVINEREPVAIFCQLIEQKESCFFIDDTGVASESISADAGGFVVVRQYDNKKVVLGKQVVDKKTTGYILKVGKSLKDKYEVTVDSVDIASEIRLNIKTNEGWEVYFNLSDDMDLQISKLILLLEKELPKESRGQLKYIDLRFKDRAYYK